MPPLSSGGASLVRPWLRFHTPLIEPDMQIYRIRLSDKTSRLHPRRAPTKPCEAYELEVPVKVREWIASALASPDFVLVPEPPAQPHSRVAVERAIRFAGGADTEVIGPSAKRAVQSALPHHAVTNFWPWLQDVGPVNAENENLGHCLSEGVRLTFSQDRPVPLVPARMIDYMSRLAAAKGGANEVYSPNRAR